MAEFWNELLTEKSWDILKSISKEPFNFIVIGDWAAYLWTKHHKSKDIDIVLVSIKEIEYLKKKYDLKKNDNLKKYEIIIDEIDIDIYIPYYSKLSIPIEDLKKYSTTIEGLKVVSAEALVILKQGAELDRKESVKGIKDQIDIMTLLCFAGLDMKVYFELLKKYNLEHYLPRVRSIVKNFKEHHYLNLTPRELKIKKKEILEKLRK